MRGHARPTRMNLDRRPRKPATRSLPISLQLQPTTVSATFPCALSSTDLYSLLQPFLAVSFIKTHTKKVKNDTKDKKGISRFGHSHPLGIRVSPGSVCPLGMFTKPLFLTADMRADMRGGYFYFGGCEGRGGGPALVAEVFYSLVHDLDCMTFFSARIPLTRLVWFRSRGRLKMRKEKKGSGKYGGIGRGVWNTQIKTAERVELHTILALYRRVI